MSYAFGPAIEQGCVRFRLWAPSADAVDLELAGRPPHRMADLDDGWKEARVEGCAAGTRYRFRTGQTTFPDPASRVQEGGVHGWSVVTEPSFVEASAGRPWHESVIYEIHAGLAGGFAGVARRLEEIAGLGFTALELMPIAAFPGERNWGYDGVLPFAPAEAYGTPDDLRRLIARAHDLGLMMFLDVVYNHFGPDGNYLPLYAAPFFRSDIHTPWGSAIDFRQQAVQTFFFENARYWIEEFGFDGLRFDAIHAIRDEGWLDRMARALRERVGPGRKIHLVVENEDNIASHLRNGFTAQWNDDIHHVLHVLLTGETSGYYQDFAQHTSEKLARGLAQGFVYQGEPLRNRDGAPRGTPSADLSPLSFVSFLQNHDQTGNRALGERLTVLARPAALRAAIALLLLSPQIPLVFMGEEIGSRAPFLYFTDHGPELAKAVREGRAREFAAFMQAAENAQLPDPNAYETFARSRPQTDAPDEAGWAAFYKSLLSLRRERIMPKLGDVRSLDAKAIGQKAVLARWRLSGGETLTIACNLDEQPVSVDLPSCPPVFGTSVGAMLAADTTLVWIEGA